MKVCFGVIFRIIEPIFIDIINYDNIILKFNYLLDYLKLRIKTLILVGYLQIFWIFDNYCYIYLFLNLSIKSKINSK